MELEVLMSCMHQRDDTLVHSSKLTGDVVIINQCDTDSYAEYPTENGMARMFSVRQRGLTKSRNLAIEKSTADVCLLCDDDEEFVDDYAAKILEAYNGLPQADVVIFKMVNWPRAFPDQIMRLHFPKTLKVCSWQISFRRERLLAAGAGLHERAVNEPVLVNEIAACHADAVGAVADPRERLVDVVDRAARLLHV